MATAIHKFELHPYEEEQEIDMPTGAQVLSVQEQHGQLIIWALVFTDVKLSKHKFLVLNTGAIQKHIAQGLSLRSFIGTVQLMEGTYVVHVFKDLR